MNDRARRQPRAGPSAPAERFEVVVCGSSRLADAVADVAAREQERRLTLAPHFEGEQPTAEAIAAWFDAIATADEVVVVVSDDLRFGEHVGAETRHAAACGVPIRLVCVPA